MTANKKSVRAIKMAERKKTMLFALEKSLGVVTTACKSTNIGRATHYEWMEKDKKYADKVEAVSETAIDFAESKLFELIQGKQFQQKFTKKVRAGEKDEFETVLTTDKNIMILPSASAVIFYLKTKAKHRGYIERSEIDLSMLGNITVGLPKEMQDD